MREADAMRLLVLDGNSIINRAFYGVKPDDEGRAVYQRAVRIFEYLPKAV